MDKKMDLLIYFIFSIATEKTISLLEAFFMHCIIFTIWEIYQVVKVTQIEKSFHSIIQ